MQQIVFVSTYDFIILPFYLAIIYLLGVRKQNRMIESRPEYKYYNKALMVRVLAGVFFAVFYFYYYGGGDMTDYYVGGNAMVNLFYKSWDFFTFALFNGNKGNIVYTFFDYSKGTPPFYMMDDPETFFVIRFITPFVFLSLKSYVVTSALTAWFAFTGIWRLFLVFYHYFPKYEKQLAFAILFFPSVLFWGSGIMKDPITLCGVGWFTYGILMVFIKKEKIFKHLIAIAFGVFLIISTKPFVIIALLPGSMVWLLFSRIKSINNKVIRVLLTPFLIVTFLFIGSLLMSSLSSNMGAYSSIDSILEKAAVTQQDLLREEAYGANSYNIGTFEPTLAGVTPKIPAALMAGLFRPYLWDGAVTNVVLKLSGLENFFLLCLVFYCFIRVGIFKFFQIIFSEPLLIFSLLFSLFFAFSIGLASANFGALVRYKIPILPFLVAMLLITLNKVQEAYKQKQEEKQQNNK